MTDEEGEAAIAAVRESMPSKTQTRYNQRDIKKRRENERKKRGIKMTDKQILEELYRRLQATEFSAPIEQSACSSFRREGHLGVNRYDIKDFIEQEWSKRDEVVCSKMEPTSASATKEQLED